MQILTIMVLVGTLFLGMVAGGQGATEKPAYIKTLSSAIQLDDSAVGFANQKTATFKAFAEAYLAGASVRTELDWLLTHGSGAGKIYAAILIETLDKEAGKKAYEALKDDKTPINYRSGSLIEERTVGDLANGLLNGEQVIIFPPSLKRE